MTIERQETERFIVGSDMSEIERKKGYKPRIDQETVVALSDMNDEVRLGKTTIELSKLPEWIKV